MNKELRVTKKRIEKSRRLGLLSYEKTILQAISDCEQKIIESFDKHNKEMKDLVDLKIHELHERNKI